MKSFFRKNDYIILIIAAIFLGIFIAIQHASNKSNLNNSSNDVLAVEIEKIARTNSELKIQVADLTKNNQAYLESLNNQANLDNQVESELQKLYIINGIDQISGQGVIMNINGKVNGAQIIDLVNSIKNIGADAISINGIRLNLYQPFDQNTFLSPYNISIIGNSSLLESALNRKGGVAELLRQRNMTVSILKSQSLTLPAARTMVMQYAKIQAN